MLQKPVAPEILHSSINEVISDFLPAELSEEKEEDKLASMKKVLIVDSTPSLLNLWEKMIERLDGDTDVSQVKASNGQAALQHLNFKKFGLVITEINMPVLSGDSMIKKMRATEINRETPVIVVSKTLKPETIKLLASLKVSKILTKPSSPEALFETVNGVVERFLPGDHLKEDKSGTGRVLIVDNKLDIITLWGQRSSPAKR